MKPKFELGAKLYYLFLGYYWSACWPVKWFYHEPSREIIYSVSDTPYGNELRYAPEDMLITSKEYQERLKDGRIRLEVKDPIGHQRYLMLVARNRYPSESSH